jgi:hypothetical protein
MPSPEDLLSPDLLDDLEHQPIERIRANRAACIEVETGLSYLRRMVQGPLDVVRRELARRASGEAGPADLSSLVEELPAVLADGTRAQGVGRLPQTLAPTVVDPELSAQLDALLADGRLLSLTAMPDEELRSFEVALTEIERRVSDRRRAFHERIDALQAELTRRYRTGEASVESLLE